ncbi:MAG TPA: beta-N-acetylglucosaminidase domain-containing protein [bacterium]|nr:beta-N-acetylglucosaminidase domain-containing protein [bacterium]
MKSIKLKFGILILMVSIFTVPFVAETRAVDDTACAVDHSEIIYPMPQFACLKADVIVPDLVKVEIDSSQVGRNALEYGERLLNGYGLKILEKDDRSERQVVSVVFEPGGPEHESAWRQEGYSILISGNPLEIKIRAHEPAGFFYAILTLEQLIHWGEAGVMVFQGEVEDFPAFSYRGILEGGYDVWNHEKRKEVLRWMGSLKMNSFLYAPKEGMYFRRRWRVPYPEEELDHFREYLAICNQWHIEFAYSLSPALSMEYSDPEEFKLMVAKYRQLQEIGVRKFGIFFDDVMPYLSTPADRKAYTHIAEAEVDVTNRLLDALREYDPTAELFFVPNQYWGWTRTRYMKILREQLYPEIEIGWTGKDICSKTITVAHVKKFIETVGRPPAIGDNFSPLGPLVNREPGLYKYCTSFVNNPYNFAEAEKAELSKFVNSTVGDYAWNTEQYDSVRSITVASRILAGSKSGGDALILALKLKNAGLPSSNFVNIKEFVDKLQSSDAMDSKKLLKEIKNEILEYRDALDALEKAPISDSLKNELGPSIENAISTIPRALEIVEKMNELDQRRALGEELKKLLGLKR